jgi:hypothetical protein
MARMMARAKADERELAWWRTEFSSRFGPGGLPRVGTCQLGRRFKLVVETRDGEWVDVNWSRDR